MLETTGADSVVSVVEVPHQFSPVSVMTLDGDRLHPSASGPPVTRRQDKPRVYARNGPAILVVRTRVLEAGSLYGHDVRGLVMSRPESVDVDDEWDLELVELMLAKH